MAFDTKRMDQLGPLTPPILPTDLFNLKRGSDEDARATAALVASFIFSQLVGIAARVATTANHGLSGLTAIDGVTPLAGDVVLVRAQTAPAQNGVYVAAAGAWARASSMDTWAKVPGAIVSVAEGTTQADTVWLSTADTGGTLGTTPITFTKLFGTNLWQPYSAKLAALAAKAWAANKGLHLTSNNTLDTHDLTAFMRGVLGSADAAAARLALGFESNTWPPTPAFTTPGDSVFTMTTQTGRYWKAGSRVDFVFDIAFDTNAYTTAAGQFNIGGLPYVAGAPGGVALSHLANVTFTANAFNPAFEVLSGDTVLRGRLIGSNTTVTNMGTGAIPASKAGIVIRGSGTYYTAS